MKKLFDFLSGKYKLVKVRNDPYPQTVEEIIDDDLKYKDEVIKAIIEFRKSKPWKGDQYAKFQALNLALSKAYNISPPLLIFTIDRPSCYIGGQIHAIFMERTRHGSYSVLTFCHEFAHSLGKNEVEACRWSTNLFKRYFPKVYTKLTPKGHLLYKEEEAKKDVEIISS